MPPQTYMYTTSIPVEIWRESWSHCERTELRTLTRTCRLFYEICLPILFAHVTHVYVPEEERSWETWSGLMILLSKCIKSIAASPKHAPLIRRWDISIMSSELVHYFADLVPDQLTDGFKLVTLSRQSLNHTVCQSLPAFTGIRTLQLFHFAFGEDLANALKALPALQNLFCKLTVFLCYPAPLLQLRKFRLDAWQEEDEDEDEEDNFPPVGTPFDIVSRNALVRLNLSSNVFPWIFTSLSSQGPCENLSELLLDDFVFHSSRFGTFFNFLASCPRLRKLSVGDPQPGRGELKPIGVIPPLPSSIIPHLQSFSGYGFLASAIIPGRPVEIVSIFGAIWTDFDRILVILKSVYRSTKPIYDLSLPWMRTNPIIISAIYAYFPKVEHLHLGFGVTPEDIHNPQPIPSYECSEYGTKDIHDTKPPLSQAFLSTLEHIHYTSQSAQYVIRNQNNARSNLRCSHKTHCPFPYAYVALLNMLASNELRLPHGLQTLEIFDLGYKEVFENESSLDWTLPDYYHDHLPKLSVLYPSLTRAAIGRYHHYSDVNWVKDCDSGHWVAYRYMSSYFLTVAQFGSDPDNC